MAHETSFEPPKGLSAFCEVWRHKFRLASDCKRKDFDIDAEAAMQYYEGPHDFIYQRRGTIGFNAADDEGAAPSAPDFRMTVNKTAELVQLFGPILYSRNPVRVVTPRRQWEPPPSVLMPPPPAQPPMPGMPPQTLGQQMAGPDPAMVMQNKQLEDDIRKAKASLIEEYLNYTPNELGLKEEMRLVIDEALVKGRGCCWTELYTPPQSQQRLVGSFFHSVDDLLVDPDMPRLETCKWIAKKCIKPVWEVERRYNLPPGYIKGSKESVEVVASVESGPLNDAKKQARTTDLVVYWEVWSKMGMGVRLKSQAQLQDTIGEGASLITEVFGDFVYLVICENCPFPLNIPHALVDKLMAVTPEGVQAFLNPPPVPEQLFPNDQPGLPPQPMLPPEIQEQVSVLKAIQPQVAWPIPFWVDDEWPVTCLDFHPRFDRPWPMAHMKPAMGEQAFVSWAYSMMATKLRSTCRDFVAISQAASDEIKQQILHGGDLSVLELDAIQRNLGEVIQFMNHPQMNKDILEIVQAIERNFEKRTGLSEAMYGASPHAYRSAAEAGLKGQMTQIRPDDMAERVESASTMIARKEGIAARLFLRGNDVAPILGNFAAQFWDQQVASDDPVAVAREFDFRIEGSSAKKPNKDAEIQNTSEAIQFVMPFLQMLGQTYNQWGPVLAFMKAWARARDFPVDEFLIDPALLQPPPPPPPPPGQEAAPAGAAPGPVPPGGPPAATAPPPA